MSCPTSLLAPAFMTLALVFGVPSPDLNGESYSATSTSAPMVLQGTVREIKPDDDADHPYLDIPDDDPESGVSTHEQPN